MRAGPTIISLSKSTSGRTALLNTMLEIGADRVMFSSDWPFENIDHAAVWFDACPISENDRVKIGRENAAAAVPVRELNSDVHS